jgi:hypothetical protein
MFYTNLSQLTLTMVSSTSGYEGLDTAMEAAIFGYMQDNFDMPHGTLTDCIRQSPALTST